MGRPLNSKFFGLTSKDGPQLRDIFAKIPGAPLTSAGYSIVRQRTNNRYEIKHTGGQIGIAQLKDGAPTVDGEMRLQVTPFGGSPENVSHLSAHDAKTFDGNTYKWVASSEGGATKIGEATLSTD